MGSKHFKPISCAMSLNGMKYHQQKQVIRCSDIGQYFTCHILKIFSKLDQNVKVYFMVNYSMLYNIRNIELARIWVEIALFLASLAQCHHRSNT